MLSSPVMRDEFVSSVRGLEAPVCGRPGCRCTPRHNATGSLKTSESGLTATTTPSAAVVAEVMKEMPEVDKEFESPDYIEDWLNFTCSRERVLAMAHKAADCYSLPQQDIDDPTAMQIRRWRKSMWGDGKTVTAAYYSETDPNKTRTYLREEWIEEWMRHHRSYYDAAPSLCVTEEDYGQVGYRF